MLGNLREHGYCVGMIRCSKAFNTQDSVCHASVGTLFPGLRGPSGGGIKKKGIKAGSIRTHLSLQTTIMCTSSFSHPIAPISFVPSTRIVLLQ